MLEVSLKDRSCQYCEHYCVNTYESLSMVQSRMKWIVVSSSEAGKDATDVWKGVTLDWRPVYVAWIQRSHGHCGPSEEDSYGSWHDENKEKENRETEARRPSSRSDLYENSIIKQDGSYSYRLVHPRDWIYMT